MVDEIIEREAGEAYDMEMETRVAILETLAAQTLGLLADMRKEADDFRSEVRSEFKQLRAEIGDLRSELRSEIGGLRSELHTEVRDIRRIHDRDFRITFGAIITATVGLAALIAHVAHWF